MVDAFDPHELLAWAARPTTDPDLRAVLVTAATVHNAMAASIDVLVEQIRRLAHLHDDAAMSMTFDVPMTAEQAASMARHPSVGTVEPFWKSIVDEPGRRVTADDLMVRHPSANAVDSILHPLHQPAEPDDDAVFEAVAGQAPADQIVDLMGALASSVEDAKAARARWLAVLCRCGCPRRDHTGTPGFPRACTNPDASDTCVEFREAEPPAEGVVTTADEAVAAVLADHEAGCDEGAQSGVIEGG